MQQMLGMNPTICSILTSFSLQFRRCCAPPEPSPSMPSFCLFHVVCKQWHGRAPFFVGGFRVEGSRRSEDAADVREHRRCDVSLLPRQFQPLPKENNNGTISFLSIETPFYMKRLSLARCLSPTLSLASYLAVAFDHALTLSLCISGWSGSVRHRRRPTLFLYLSPHLCTQGQILVLDV